MDGEGGREEIFRRIDEVRKLVGFVVGRQMRLNDRRRFYEEDDLIQEGLCGVIANAHRFDPARGSFSTFVCKAAWTWIVNYVYTPDARQKHIPRDLIDSLDKIIAHSNKDRSVMRLGDILGSAENVEAQIVSEDFAEYLAGIMESDLSEVYRDVLRLCYWERMSYAEIGRLYGVTDSAIGDKVVRARKILKARLKQDNKILYGDRK